MLIRRSTDAVARPLSLSSGHEEAMTDQPAPEAQIDPVPPGPPPGALLPAPGPKPGNKRAIVIVGAIIAFLVVVLFVVKDNGAADDLKVGDCFDNPTATSVSTVVHHPCTESHTAEVFHVVEYTGTETVRPISLILEGFVDTACRPVFATYVGKEIDAVPDLAVNYFYPSVDGWSSGDRTITCYATRTDEGPMTTSVKGSAQ
jgi:hypothetical protein